MRQTFCIFDSKFFCNHYFLSPNFVPFGPKMLILLKCKCILVNIHCPFLPAVCFKNWTLTSFLSSFPLLPIQNHWSAVHIDFLSLAAVGSFFPKSGNVAAWSLKMCYWMRNMKCREQVSTQWSSMRTSWKEKRPMWGSKSAPPLWSTQRNRSSHFSPITVPTTALRSKTHSLENYWKLFVRIYLGNKFNKAVHNIVSRTSQLHCLERSCKISKSGSLHLSSLGIVRLSVLWDPSRMQVVGTRIFISIMTYILWTIWKAVDYVQEVTHGE